MVWRKTARQILSLSKSYDARIKSKIDFGGLFCMKLFRSVVLLATLALSASANDISGTWKVWFVGPIDERPKMVSEMTFDLTVDGDKVTGMAHMANWPGDAPISEGKIDG